MEPKEELLDELMKGVKTQADLAGPKWLLERITSVLAERILAGS